MSPTCPRGYSCKFTPLVPKYHYAQWWDGPWGIVVVIFALIALATVIIVVAYYIQQARKDRLGFEADERRRSAADRQALALEEQRTMQLDAAKGNPEMLKDRPRPRQGEAMTNDLHQRCIEALKRDSPKRVMLVGEDEYYASLLETLLPIIAQGLEDEGGECPPEDPQAQLGKWVGMKYAADFVRSIQR